MNINTATNDKWEEERVLGSGGFGQVVLWRNQETGDYIALKKCRVQSEMTSKHRQRWAMEVDIMKRLEHLNVVAARDVPPSLDVGRDELPLLAMEYCSGGDLRRVLNKPESCCGLKEYEIRTLVKDIASAVEYLHKKRIIHRDLKPENIVLEPSEDRTIYKLIDLGYAKELDQGSVCTSFVGTLQYLAPELFASQKYTCTVDYWSFGTVVFECITGYRPFLPQIPPVTWHREVCKKSPDDVCAYHNAEGEVKFSKKIISPNYLCRSMQAYFEQWLRYMLRWDPKSRGGGLTEGRPHCFKLLDTMLTMKIVNILNVETNQVLSYPLMEQNSMLELQKSIEKETNIPVDMQDILLPKGSNPDPNQSAIQCWTYPGDTDWMVFLFKKGDSQESVNKKYFKPLPQRVQRIVREAQTHLPYQEQKKAWAEAVYFCGEQAIDFRRLLLGQRAVMLSLLNTNSNFLKMKQKMVNDCDNLMAKIQYFKDSLFHDLENHKVQLENGGIDANMMCAKWRESGENVQKHVMLQDMVKKLDQQVITLQTKIVELQRSPFARAKKIEALEETEKKAKDLYQGLRQTGKSDRSKDTDHKPMVHLVVSCVMARDKSLKDLYTHLGKICSLKEQVSLIQPGILECCKLISEASEKLIQAQKQRQSDMWHLIKISLEKSRDTIQDTKSGPSSGQSSMAASMYGATSLESLRVCEDSRDTVEKVGNMMQILMEEQDEYMMSMDWSFLPPLSKES